MRVEVRAATKDVSLIKAVAETLRGHPEQAELLRRTLQRALNEEPATTAFDIFGSDLPDDAFAGVFDQPRTGVWRNTADVARTGVAVLDPFSDR